MTKEEFLSMISNELEKLEQEYKTVSQQVEYFNAIGLSDKIPAEIEYRLKIVKQKIEILKNLLTLPAVARIEVMSDIEIEEYKNEKIKELELKIKELQAREEQEKEKLSQLQAEQKKLMEEFAKNSGAQRDIIIAQGKQISTEIIKQEDVLAKLEEEKNNENFRGKQEEIKTKSSQDIKQELLLKIKEGFELKQKIQSPNHESIEEFIKLEATVAPDQEKAMELANLFSDHKTLSNQSYIYKYAIDFYYLPELLKQKLTENREYYNLSTYVVRNPDKLIDIISEFESIFKREKEKFLKEFTEEKLYNLVGKLHGINNSDNIDMVFLRQHDDKLYNDELDHLQSLIEQRKLLLKKKIKTKNTKHEIYSLNSQIKNEASRIYREIIAWYQNQSNDILNTHSLSHSDFIYGDRITNSLEGCKKDIYNAEREIAKVKEKLQKIKANMEEEKQVYETNKTKIAEINQKIRALGGEEYKDTEIPSYLLSTGVQDNLDRIQNAQALVYEKDIIKSVQEEAQKQADIKEAELRGLTLEKLLKKKQQVQ